MNEFDKYDTLFAILLMFLVALVSLCSMATTIYAIVFFNPVLVLCSGFFAGLFGRMTWKLYKLVISMLDEL